MKIEVALPALPAVVTVVYYFDFGEILTVTSLLVKPLSKPPSV